MGFRLQEVPGVQAQGREGMGMVGGGRCYVAQSLTLGWEGVCSAGQMSERPSRALLLM